MYNKELSERFRYLKETEGGRSKMCKLIEERAKEYAIEQQIENITTPPVVKLAELFIERQK